MRFIGFRSYQPLFFVLICVFPFLFGCALDNITRKPNIMPPAWITHYYTNIPAESSQLLFVAGEAPPDVFVHVYALERQKTEWIQPFPHIDAIIGAKGFAEPGTKREGDGKTPTGIFPLEFVFGYDETANTRMQYRQATEADIWVDDPRSDDYNSWARKTETKAASFEEMKRKDGLYKYGIVVGYNTQPVIKGNGSAIFLHVRAENNRPTSGCVGMTEEDLLKIIGWLDPARKPLILMGTENTLRKPVQ